MNWLLWPFSTRKNNSRIYIFLPLLHKIITKLCLNTYNIYLYLPFFIATNKCAFRQWLNACLPSEYIRIRVYKLLITIDYHDYIIIIINICGLNSTRACIVHSTFFVFVCFYPDRRARYWSVINQFNLYSPSYPVLQPRELHIPKINL